MTLTGLASGPAEVARNYTVDARGVIRSPGAFQGEPGYVVYFWELAGMGYGSEKRGLIAFELDQEDKATWPVLAHRSVVKIRQLDNGHVTEVSWR